jgi:hypothetical protein
MGVMNLPQGGEGTSGAAENEEGGANFASDGLRLAVQVRHALKGRRCRGRKETGLRGWGDRTRSAPGDRQGVGGASPLR